MSGCIAQAAEPFLWRFLGSCSSQAGLLRQTGAGAFVKCQVVDDSGLESYFTAVLLAVLVHVLSTCAAKTLGVVEVMDTTSSHTACELP